MCDSPRIVINGNCNKLDNEKTPIRRDSKSLLGNFLVSAENSNLANANTEIYDHKLEWPHFVKIILNQF